MVNDKKEEQITDTDIVVLHKNRRPITSHHFDSHCDVSNANLIDLREENFIPSQVRDTLIFFIAGL